MATSASPVPGAAARLAAAAALLLALMLPAALGHEDKDNPPEPAEIAERIIETVRSQLDDPDRPFAIAVHVRAKAGHVEEVARLYARQVERSRHDDGVISYDMNRDADDPAAFLLYERWRNLNAFIAHERHPRTLEMFTILGPLLEDERRLQVYTLVEESAP